MRRTAFEMLVMGANVSGSNVHVIPVQTNGSIVPCPPPVTACVCHQKCTETGLEETKRGVLHADRGDKTWEGAGATEST